MQEENDMQRITPFIWFNEQTEEAVHFYTSLFKNSKVDRITRFGDYMPGPQGKVLTANFRLDGLELMALNGGPEYSINPAISFFVYCQTPEEIDALWKNLSAGGQVMMELDRYPFSEKFGWVADRYGVSWQLDLVKLPQKITPFLMFVREQNGKAEEAIQYYVSVFKNSSIGQIVHYDSGEGGPSGNVQHARFTLNGQEFMAMDGGPDHAFSFTPAMSLFVNCEDQAEVDYFWEKLSAGGEKGPCGWLTDKFGISWQIVPTLLGDLMNDPDRERAKRVTQAMLQMTKIDIDQLQRAYNRETA
jgi:predicted 3-demethylubiquinone-9 3-methyltransferase (glyoxalase superfamily)